MQVTRLYGKSEVEKGAHSRLRDPPRKKHGSAYRMYEQTGPGEFISIKKIYIHILGCLLALCKKPFFSVLSLSSSLVVRFIHSGKKCGIKIPHLMWMVIYAHPLCTYILLNVYVSCIRNFLHKKVLMFWQVRVTAELFNINHSSQRGQRGKQRPQPPTEQARL